MASAASDVLVELQEKEDGLLSKIESDLLEEVMNENIRDVIGTLRFC